MPTLLSRPGRCLARITRPCPAARTELAARMNLAVRGLALPAIVLLLTAAAPPPAHPRGQAVPTAPGQSTHIVAVVNGDVISNDDVNNRARLFAVSTGLSPSPDVLARLKPQILRQLIDEKLRLQEILRNKIVVHDAEIADAIKQIAGRNGMTADALRAKLSADGISLTTLIDQIRTQIGWNDLLRLKLGDNLHVTPAEIAEQQRLMQAQTGKPEFRVGEIFIPVENPANAADAQRFAQTVITELRGGAPFPVVAAEFSQDQSALSGGDRGWVTLNQLDPDVAKVVQEMPAGAVSNPIDVPGGIAIVTLGGKRIVGQDVGTVVSLREAFLPFATKLNPAAPTEAQRQTLDKARQISASVHSCDQMTQLAQTLHSPHPADPGPVRLDSIQPPAFRDLIGKIPYNQATQPLVSNDGIAVVIVCSRQQENLAQLSPKEIANTIVDQRVELLSRQLLRALHRHASIQMFPGAA